MNLSRRSPGEPNGEARRKAIGDIAGCYGLTPPRRPSWGDPEASWTFSTREGVGVQFLRYRNLADGARRYLWQRREGNGRWINGLSDLQVLLYRHEQVVKAIEDGLPIYVAEGAKDADALCKLGVVATTAPSATTLDEHHIEILKKATCVVVVPDADLPGRDYAERVGRQLHDAVGALRVVDLYPARDDGSDADDWVEEKGITPDEGRIFLRLSEEPFDTWASEYLRNRPVMGLVETLKGSLATNKTLRRTATAFARELRIVETRQVPFSEWLLQESQYEASGIEDEVIAVALALESEIDGGEFSTRDLLDFMRDRSLNLRMTIQSLGSLLTRVGVPSKNVWLPSTKKIVKLRRFSDVRKAAAKRGIVSNPGVVTDVVTKAADPGVDAGVPLADLPENSAPTEEVGGPYQIPRKATDPSDPVSARASLGLATLGARQTPVSLDSSDSSDPEALIGVPREKECPSRNASEEREGREARLSKEVESLINGLDADTREDFEERAAILEFCGEMPQVEAEVQAYALVTGPKVSDFC